MTMLTIIISSVVLLRFGVSGTTGMIFVMAMAGMVCTALSVSGQAVTDFKAGYWLGSTPAAQQKVKFLGVIAASLAVGLTIVMLAHAFQFGEAAPGEPDRHRPGGHLDVVVVQHHLSPDKPSLERGQPLPAVGHDTALHQLHLKLLHRRGQRLRARRARSPRS